MAIYSVEKVRELSEALRKSGVATGSEVQNFLKKKRYSLKVIRSRGGWMPILMDMVPGKYKPVDELVEAIKDFQ